MDSLDFGKPPTLIERHRYGQEKNVMLTYDQKRAPDLQIGWPLCLRIVAKILELFTLLSVQNFVDGESYREISSLTGIGEVSGFTSAKTWSGNRTAWECA